MEGKKKSAFIIESKWQVIGTEGSIPGRSGVRDICQREAPSGPLSGVINSLHIKFPRVDNLVASVSGSLISTLCNCH